MRWGILWIDFPGALSPELTGPRPTVLALSPKCSPRMGLVVLIVIPSHQGIHC